jgi:protein-tyrosine phosphatase
VIDLHSHLLPAVDDGARTVDQSVAVMAALAHQGVTDICLTPHVLASRAADGVPEAHDRAFEAVAPHAPKALKLLRGAEVMLDRPLPDVVADRRDLTLNRTRYILVEFPRLVTNQTVTQAVSLVRELGLIPLIAHPERYACCSPATVRKWRKGGAVTQVDATTLFLPRTRGERARALVAEGLADILAADNHGDERSVATAFEALREQSGLVQGELLITRNPRAILNDRELEPVPPLAVRVSLIERLRGLFDAESS